MMIYMKESGTWKDLTDSMKDMLSTSRHQFQIGQGLNKIVRNNNVQADVVVVNIKEKINYDTRKCNDDDVSWPVEKP